MRDTKTIGIDPEAIAAAVIASGELAPPTSLKIWLRGQHYDSEGKLNGDIAEWTAYVLCGLDGLLNLRSLHAVTRSQNRNSDGFGTVDAFFDGLWLVRWRGGNLHLQAVALESVKDIREWNAEARRFGSSARPTILSDAEVAA